MDRKNFQVVVPANPEGVSSEPFLNLNAGYIQRANNILPKQGSKRPWRVYQNYLMDAMVTRLGKINDGVLKFQSKENVE